ncbi:MAG: DNA ligase [candidate division Zixibacteria bacterium]|nr:DNA ligase [candidate division Zixibacteria bacterium]
MSKKDSLKEYRKKRDFKSTSEPTGKKKKSSDKPIFVIQKHDASNLHYDFRLEIDGVLKSWAIPKGPSMDPRDKRLAILTEDHPIGYAEFEGVIPEEEYGGGTVMIWDRGTYENIKGENDDEEKVKVIKAYKNGHLTVFLHGDKLEGGYALIKTKRGKGDQWLLIKMDDEYADARRNPVSSQPKSAVSGRTIKQIEKDEKS